MLFLMPSIALFLQWAPGVGVDRAVRSPNRNPAVPAVIGRFLQHHVELEDTPPIAGVTLQHHPAFEHGEPGHARISSPRLLFRQTRDRIWYIRQIFAHLDQGNFADLQKRNHVFKIGKSAGANDAGERFVQAQKNPASRIRTALRLRGGMNWQTIELRRAHAPSSCIQMSLRDHFQMATSGIRDRWGP